MQCVVNSCTSGSHSAPAYSTQLLWQFLAKHSIPQVRKPPLLGDVACYDFLVFPKFQGALKGKRFNDIETIEQKVLEHLLAIPKSEFERCCFQHWRNGETNLYRLMEPTLKRINFPSLCKYIVLGFTDSLLVLCPCIRHGSLWYEGKGKVVPVLLTEHHAMKVYWGVDI
jgi:hypothetical protein